MRQVRNRVFRRAGWGMAVAVGVLAAGSAQAQFGQIGGGPIGGGPIGGGPGIGGPFSPGGGNQIGQGFPGGRQGGVFGMGGSTTLASNGTVRLAAFCTDLLSEPPDSSTRFAGGDTTTLVAFANGRRMTLSQALASQALSLRGRDDSFDPVRRDGSLALDLYLTNQSGQPVRLTVAAGTQVTPNGQGAQALPQGSERLFAAAAARRLALSNTMQYAVWAARGSTAEEVEQANMVKLPAMEIGKVQSLLNESGIRQEFDRNRGVYAAKYEEAIKKLGEKVETVTGTTTVPPGGRATVEGVRTPDGKGFVTVKVHQSRARFYYGAQFSQGKDGRTQLKLTHLVTGKPVRTAGTLQISPSTALGGTFRNFCGTCWSGTGAW